MQESGEKKMGGVREWIGCGRWAEMGGIDDLRGRGRWVLAQAGAIDGARAQGEQE